MSAGFRFLASEGQYRRILTSGTLLQHLGTSQPWDHLPPLKDRNISLPASTIFVNTQHIFMSTCLLLHALSLLDYIA